MKTNIHVLSSGMMAKAKPHMDVRSLPLRRIYWFECRITLDAAAPWDSKGLLACNAPWVPSPPRQYNDENKPKIESIFNVHLTPFNSQFKNTINDVKNESFITEMGMG